MKRIWKTRTVLAALLTAAILSAVYCGISAFLFPGLVLEKERTLSQHSIIEAKAWPDGDAFLLGDSISYFVEVKYSTQIIEELDKTSIDKNLILEPFETRSQSEKEFKIDSHTKVFLREYQIQLVSGEPGKTYFFPPLPLRYKLKNAGYFDKKLSLQPIPIGSRFPADAKGIELKSADETVVNKSRRYFQLVIVGLGISCGIWGAAEVFKKITKRAKTSQDFQKKLEGIEDIFKAYQELSQKRDAEPKIILHKAYQIMRTLLSRKEGIDWAFWDRDWESIPSEVRLSVRTISDMSQKAYDRRALDGQEIIEVLSELGKTFDFYIRKGEE